MASQAEAKTYSYRWSDKNNESHWLNLYTDTMKNGKSGVIFRNYYSSQDFSKICPDVEKITKRESQNTFFLTYRKVSSIDADEKSWVYMRQLKMSLNKSYLTFNIDKKVFTDDINDEELKSLKNKMINNKDDYLSDFRNYRNKLSALKQSAEDLERTRTLNLNTQADLEAARQAKQAELDQTKATLKALNTQAEASRLASRNLEKERQRLAQEELKPLLDQLESMEQGLKALQDKIKDNDAKIKGVVPIDQNDLADSKTSLRNTLVLFQNTFLQLDPRYTAIDTCVKGLPGTMSTVGSVIA